MKVIAANTIYNEHSFDLNWANIYNNYINWEKKDFKYLA